MNLSQLSYLSQSVYSAFISVSQVSDTLCTLLVDTNVTTRKTAKNRETFMHTVQKSAPVFRLVFEVLGRFFKDMGQDFQVLEWYVMDLEHVILIF